LKWSVMLDLLMSLVYLVENACDLEMTKAQDNFAAII
jgi:hypothetical protein